jgi:hypothetical protein
MESEEKSSHYQALGLLMEVPLEGKPEQISA